MGRSFLASTLLINQNVADQRMRVEGMRDGEMALLLSAEGQDKRRLPQIQPLHEVLDSILYLSLCMLLVSPYPRCLTSDT